MSPEQLTWLTMATAIVSTISLVLHFERARHPADKTISVVAADFDAVVAFARSMMAQGASALAIPPSTPQAPVVAVSAEVDALLARIAAATKAAPVVMLLAALFSVGCSASTRQTTLKAATTTMLATEAAVIAYDRTHETEIATDTTTSPEQRHAELATYRGSRARVEIVVDTAWRALAIAGPLTDDASMTAVKTALAQVAMLAGQLLGGGK